MGLDSTEQMRETTAGGRFCHPSQASVPHSHSHDFQPRTISIFFVHLLLRYIKVCGGTPIHLLGDLCTAPVNPGSNSGTSQLQDRRVAPTASNCQQAESPRISLLIEA